VEIHVRRAADIASLLIFIILVAAAGALGSRFPPGDWYAHLIKAPWTPPNWVFAPAWSLLYLLIALAGWLVWRAKRASSVAICLWVGQLLLNAAWSWLFFGRHNLGLALLDVGLLALAIVAFMVASASTSRLASWLFAPYALWILFAMSLNFYAWFHNALRGGT
jgi:tryptophan-rich sensory protein